MVRPIICPVSLAFFASASNVHVSTKQITKKDVNFMAI